MNNDSTRQERIFKIFTPVRCLSRDQLPRYLNGNMTDWEKHLIEHHLVDCDLCHDAVESLKNTKNQEPYERLSKQMSLYLQREYAPAVQQSQQKVRRTHQGDSTSESLLSYFWVIMFLILGGGSIFLLQQHLKNRPVLAAVPPRTTDALVIPQKNEPIAQVTEPTQSTDTKPTVIQTQYSVKDSTGNKPLALNTKLTAKDSALLANKKKIVKDTVKLKKTPVTDTATRIIPKPATPAEKETPKEKEEKATAATPPPTPKEKEKEKEKEKAKEDPKPAPPTITGDESLFRAAMLYQQQGDVNEAMNQFRKLSTNYKYAERAKYQLALCYRTKGQNGKARRLLKEIVKMEGPLKAQAQTELNNLD